MKKLSIYLMSAGLFFGAGAQAQQQRSCATMVHEQRLQQQNPTHFKKRQFAEHKLQQFIEQSPNRQTNNVITIPVVVHVVYNTAAQNISDAQVLSQIEVLNEDFRKLNADASQVPALFQGLAADTEIQFCMAQRDPNGNATTGITRTQTNVSSFDTNDDVKFASQGGKDAWDTGKYLNMWVCPLGNGLLGYAQFPGGPAATDGVVMGFDCFGRIGNVSAPFNKGRTATHEIGHWLELFHIWGDDNCGDDLVNDTPTQQSFNFGCPSFPHATCGNTSDMFMNYMDYVDDACMVMFSQGQKARMLAALNTSRSSLLTSDGCLPPGTGGGATDAGILNIVAPGPASCMLTFSPVVTLQNFGGTILNTVTIGFSLDNGMPATFQWTGSLAPGASVNVVLPQVTTSAGIHSFSASTVNPNNTTDADITNNSQTVNFVANDNVAAIALPVTESFEGSATGWQVQNPDNNITWEVTSAAAKTGSKSYSINNFNYDAAGQADFLVMPPVDLTTMLSPMLSFELAYTLFTNPTATPNYSDTLQVWVSTDCGATWNILYNKSGAALATTSPVFQNSEFTPTASDWRKEVIDLTPVAGSNYAQFAFRNTTGFENNLYLDDVNIAGLSANAEVTLDEVLKLYPNPTTGLFDITVNEQLAENLEVTLFDQLGRQVQVNTMATEQGSVRVDLRNLSEGVYIAKVKAGNSVAVRKVVLSR